MKTCVLIPARGGSKGIPKKNIKHLGGKPLIKYTLDVAQILFPIENIVVSTDDYEIKNCVEQLGYSVPYMRPTELAQDDTATAAVVQFELERWKIRFGEYPEHVILLQPTSPFRKVTHLEEAFQLYANLDYNDLVVSVSASKHNPYYTLFEEKSGLLVQSKKGDFTRRQDCPEVWELNGAIYIFRSQSFLENGFEGMNKVKYVMKEIDSLDLDTLLDWSFAEFLLERE
jgi:CMP-N,N'-diacetyllegionaminic acid synthase